MKMVSFAQRTEVPNGFWYVVKQGQTQRLLLVSQRGVSIRLTAAMHHHSLKLSCSESGKHKNILLSSHPRVMRSSPLYETNITLILLVCKP